MANAEQKVKIVTDFLLNAPPGEFNEVFSDVRQLVGNDQSLIDRIQPVVTKYNRDHFVPVKIEGSEEPALITEFNDLGGGRFYDPRTQKSFRFDHFRREASEYQVQTLDPDTERLEKFRKPLETALTDYVHSFYKSGCCGVFAHRDDAQTTIINCCIECHAYQSKNFWNGRWRSVYTIRINGPQAEFSGQCIVHVHYYEDGNVQLLVSKDLHGTANAADPYDLATQFVRFVEKEEGSFHGSVNETYSSMGDSTFKALRRQLPVTKSKIDWEKLLSYKVGAELRGGVSG